MTTLPPPRPVKLTWVQQEIARRQAAQPIRTRVIGGQWPIGHAPSGPILPKETK